MHRSRSASSSTRKTSVRSIISARFGALRARRYVRPCIAVKGFGSDACLVVPLTTSPRTHPPRIAVGTIEGRGTHANLSRIRVADTRRLQKRIGFFDKQAFVRLRKAAKSNALAAFSPFSPLRGEAEANCILKDVILSLKRK